ncbi:MAG: chaperonin GroEL, partial [Mesorhizobium sp.]
RVGNDGVITVEDGTSLETELEFVEGMQFDRGYISPHFITNRAKMRVEMQDAYVLISEKKLSSLNEVLPLLEKVVQAGKPLLIIADDVEGEVIAALVVNKLRGALQERLARLAGGVAVIRVGGATEVEVREKKDRIDDAMNATRAAVAEGILPGGGVALLRAGRALKKLKGGNEEQQVGIAIVRKAITWPARQIAINAGLEGSVVIAGILENDDNAYGYDAQSGVYGDLVLKGIIDPAKVVRTALQGAASVAGLLIMTEAMVAEVPGPPPPELPGHEHHHHDMDLDF